MRTARGFTLVEILVSIMIFSVVGLAMVTVLFQATDLFRRAESARSAGDEATAVIAALQDDLSRMVPVRLDGDGVPAKDGGWLFSKVDATGTGNCILAFVIENPDRNQITTTGGVARKLVAWWVEKGTDPSADELRRREYDWDPGSGGERTQAQAPNGGSVISRGCLHFGAWFELAEQHRPVTASDGAVVPDWEGYQPPDIGLDVCSSMALGPPEAKFYPRPDAVRISLILTGGGRYVTRGHIARAASVDDDALVITGIKTLPTVAGSRLRIGDEWIRYGDFRSGRVIDAVRGALRSVAVAHDPGTLVVAGQMFSLVAAIPR